jgi:hypothetical protein
VCVDVGRHLSGSHSLGALSGWLGVESALPGGNHGTCTVSGILVRYGKVTSTFPGRASIPVKCMRLLHFRREM